MSNKEIADLLAKAQRSVKAAERLLRDGDYVAPTYRGGRGLKPAYRHEGTGYFRSGPSYVHNRRKGAFEVRCGVIQKRWDSRSDFSPLDTSLEN